MGVVGEFRPKKGKKNRKKHYIYVLKNKMEKFLKKMVEYVWQDAKYYI